MSQLKPTSPLSLFVRNVAHAGTDPEIQGLGAFILIMMLIGTVFYSVVEGWNFVDSFYHSAMILTTIGASDLTPVTPIGKIFTVVFVFIGLGSVLGFVAVFAGHIHGRPPKKP